MVIYKTTNLINNKIYIGQDSKNNPKYLGSGVIFLKALKKYNKNNFSKEIIDSATSIEELNLKEIFWINKFNSTNQKIGYNISLGGSGISLSKEILRKKSDKAKKEGTYLGENNGNFKYKITEKELYYFYITQNLKIDEIAKYYGCYRTVISTNLKRYGIIKPLTNKYGFNQDDLYRYYMINNLSYADISKIYGCSNKTIFKVIKKYGWNNENTIKTIKKSKFGLTKEILYQDYCVDKLNKTEISNKYNCTIQLLNYTLKKYNLKNG